MDREQQAHIQSGWQPRQIQSRIYDSTRWDSVNLRDDDIIIATWAKSGTTLTQQIVSQLISGGADRATSYDESPWVDARFFAPVEVMASMLEAQKHRRFMKTHLPFDAVPFRHTIKYIFIGRDARDVVWSAYNHAKSFTPATFARFNSFEGPWPAREPVKTDVKAYYLNWLETGEAEGFLDMPFWSHVQGWWDQRHLPNVLLLHYAKVIADLPGEMRRIARFLDIPIDETRLPLQVEHCDIGYMREEARKHGQLHIAFEHGAESFFYKGTNGRWKDVLSAEEIARCDAVAAANLTPDCAHWLKTGERRD